MHLLLTRNWRWAIGALLAGAMSFVVVSCVGDDPITGTRAAEDAGDAATPQDSSTDGPGPTDGGDGGAPCNPTAAFGQPALISELSSVNNKDELAPFLNDDENRIWFISARDGEPGVYFAVRGPSGKFEAPQAVNLRVDAGVPIYYDRVSLTADETTIYITASETSLADGRIYVAKRTDITQPTFDTPVLVSGFNATSGIGTGAAFVNAAGTRIYFARETSTNLFHIRSAECATPAACGAERTFSEIDTAVPVGDTVAVLDRSETTLYFASHRDGGPGRSDIFRTTRSDIAGSFGAVDLVLSLGGTAGARPGWLSKDSCRLYISTYKNGNADIYMMTRPR
jgi:hypothetical protein